MMALLWLVIINSQLNELAKHFNCCENLFTNGLIKETVSTQENIYGSFEQYITTDVGGRENN